MKNIDAHIRSNCADAFCFRKIGNEKNRQSGRGFRKLSQALRRIATGDSRVLLRFGSRIEAPYRPEEESHRVGVSRPHVFNKGWNGLLSRLNGVVP
jgi:hypothetical protein